MLQPAVQRQAVVVDERQQVGGRTFGQGSIAGRGDPRVGLVDITDASGRPGPDLAGRAAGRIIVDDQDEAFPGVGLRLPDHLRK